MSLKKITIKLFLITQSYFKMNYIPFSKYLISYNQAIIGGKRATGLVDEWERLLNPEFIELLRSEHNGIFCHLFFNPIVDKEVNTFIESGALSSEAGDKIIVLLSAQEVENTKRTRKGGILNNHIKLDFNTGSNEKIFKYYFGNDLNAVLPGFIVFDCVPKSRRCIFFSFMNQNTTEVGNARRVLKLIHECYHKSDKANFLNHLAKSALLENIEFTKNYELSFGEFVVYTFKILKEYKSELFSLMSI